VNWKGKKVFITGHTGFKGSWLTLWLLQQGVDVFGYSFEPPSQPYLFDVLQLQKEMQSQYADIRNFEELSQSLQKFQPEFVFHLAAQPLVRRSYKDPIETYSTNVMGTVHLLEAVRQCPSVRVCEVITSDKCYENQERLVGYKESEPMGGHDPYSSSKACAELVTSSFRNSFFQNPQGVLLASARAGNVIGGGDWAEDRLIPDLVTQFYQGKTVLIRNPKSIRPWQHVLEPVGGYIRLAEALYEKGVEFSEAWNFGPQSQDERPVLELVQMMSKLWKKEQDQSSTEGKAAQFEVMKEARGEPHEACYLKLDITKARERLQWEPRWNLETALEKTVQWYTAYYYKTQNLKELTLSQIREYQN